MSDLVAIVSVGVSLGALMLAAFLAIRAEMRELRAEMRAQREEFRADFARVHAELADLSQRVARIEGAMWGGPLRVAGPEDRGARGGPVTAGGEPAEQGVTG